MLHLYRLTNGPITLNHRYKSHAQAIANLPSGTGWKIEPIRNHKGKTMNSTASEDQHVPITEFVPLSDCPSSKEREAQDAVDAFHKEYPPDDTSKPPESPTESAKPVAPCDGMTAAMRADLEKRLAEANAMWPPMNPNMLIVADGGIPTPTLYTAAHPEGVHVPLRGSVGYLYSVESVPLPLAPVDVQAAEASTGYYHRDPIKTTIPVTSDGGKTWRDLTIESMDGKTWKPSSNAAVEGKQVLEELKKDLERAMAVYMEIESFKKSKPAPELASRDDANWPDFSQVLITIALALATAFCVFGLGHYLGWFGGGK